MKKLKLAAVAMLIAITASAQGPQKPPPPEERWKHDSNIISEKTEMTSADILKMKPSFIAFYSDMDALMKKNNGERPKKEDVEPLIKKRNDAIRKMITASQFQSFVKIERELGPRRPGGKDAPPQRKN